ncbi:LytR/AlgR family response regulator transcription factor [Olivibacter domesticus]|uniref:Two component transcriptional regulator, LytTR family n=1 Tax=Olivibacter domesticus TaxID=407022 RepID=A0A1H7LV96_OLID1|nr:LytTR family DNA-binding domain-containing protein [Olivibacter domesticus]SEL02871.1 two component transcriptional regulator, LytTR family [Olivibacter domesticus]
MIQAIAVDDEPIALEVIQKLAEKVSFLQIKETFTNAFQAMEYLQVEKIDLLFLDIKMPDISGIEFFNSLHIKPLVIFTTAYGEHALTGFELDAVDYLLKPFSIARFIKACNKTREILQIRKGGLETPNLLIIKTGYGQIKVNCIDIYYLEATGNYVTFINKDQSIISRMTLTECIDLLPKEQFIRIHRSFIINIDAIDKMERHQITINGYILPIAASYRKSLIELFERSK